jgi:hypothetical protein
MLSPTAWLGLGSRCRLRSRVCSMFRRGRLVQPRSAREVTRLRITRCDLPITPQILPVSHLRRRHQVHLCASAGARQKYPQKIVLSPEQRSTSVRLRNTSRDPGHKFHYRHFMGVAIEEVAGPPGVSGSSRRRAGGARGLADPPNSKSPQPGVALSRFRRELRQRRGQPLGPEADIGRSRSGRLTKSKSMHSLTACRQLRGSTLKREGVASESGT